MMSPKKLSLGSYRLGWICPLEVEQLAAMEMLDEEHEPLGQPRADNNVYRLGSINGHNVVVAGLHQTGNCPAATVVTQMKMTFPNLRYGLLVGVGGGVPVETDSGLIRLGHVVVGKPTGEHSGVVQYDHGKAREGHFERTGSLMPPPAALLNAAQALAVKRARMDYDPIWKDIQRIPTERRGLRQFKFPGYAADYLYKPDYGHRQIGVSCEKGGCSPEKRIERAIDEDEGSFVVVHRGTIASGELVLKDAKHRDRLAQKYGLLCFEMEAAGVLADFPCMVIRGISDYCDSHKNDNWHGFAAAAAAAYTRQLFFHMPIEATQISKSHDPLDLSKFNQFFVPYNENPEFVGRSKILTTLKQQLGFGQPQGSVKSRTRVALYGLGGIGKTQIALAYVYWLSENCPDVAVFWVHGSNAEQFHEAYDSIAKEYKIPEHDDPKVDVSGLVKTWLEKSFKTRWLMVVDNADDTELFFRSQQDNKATTPVTQAPHRRHALGRYIPECRHGSILVTTRNKQAGLRLTQGRSSIEVGNMDKHESHLLLCAILGDDQLSEHETHLLSSKLEHLPLALAQAASFIQENTIPINEYIQLLDESDSALADRLSEPFETVGRDSETPHAVTATWIISFELIERQSALASNFLSFLSLFHWQAIPKECVDNYCSRMPADDTDAVEKAAITKALGTLKAFSLISEDKDRNIDMHRLVQLVTRKLLATRSTMAGFRQQALKTMSVVYPYGRYETSDRCLQLLPHAYALLENSECTYQNKTIAKAMLLHKMGGYFLYQGNWDKAEECQVGAIEILVEEEGKEDQSMVASMGNLALTFLSQGRWEEAEKLGMQVMEMSKTKLGVEHPDTLTSMANLASTYGKQGRWEEAEKLGMQVMETSKIKLGIDHPNTLTSMANLAWTWKSQGRDGNALALMQTCAEARGRVLGITHPNTLSSLSALHDWKDGMGNSGSEGSQR